MTEIKLRDSHDRRWDKVTSPSVIEPNSLYEKLLREGNPGVVAFEDVRTREVMGIGGHPSRWSVGLFRAAGVPLVPPSPPEEPEFNLISGCYFKRI